MKIPKKDFLIFLTLVGYEFTLGTTEGSEFSIKQFHELIPHGKY